jgi:GAF domain-containing protein
MLLEAGLWSDSAIQKLMKDKGHTAGSLLEYAMDRQKQELIELDQSIAQKAATLLQLQKSYEVLVNRSVLQERLKLQNELLKRDLFAIDVPMVKDAKLVEQDTLPEALKDASQEAHEPSDKG